MSSEASACYQVDQSEKGERSVSSLVKSYAAVTRSHSLSAAYHKRPNPPVQRGLGERKFRQHRSSTHGRGRGENNLVSRSSPKGSPGIPRQPNQFRQQGGEITSDGKYPAAAAVGRKKTNQASPRAGSTLASARDSPSSNDSSSSGKRTREAQSPTSPEKSKNGGPCSQQLCIRSNSLPSLNSTASSGESNPNEEDSSSSSPKSQTSPTALGGAGKQRSWVLRRNLYQSGAVNDPNWAALQKQAEEARARAAAAKKKAEQQALEASKEQAAKKQDKALTNNDDTQNESDEDVERESTVKFEDVVTVYEDDIAGQHSTSFVAFWTSGSDSDSDEDNEDSKAKSNEETADADSEMVVKY